MSISNNWEFLLLPIWPAFTNISFFPLNINHWNRCALVFCCGFNLYFPSDELYWTSFHVFICQSYIFLICLNRWGVCSNPLCVLIAQPCLTLCDPMDSQVPLSMESSRQEYWSAGVQLQEPGIQPEEMTVLANETAFQFSMDCLFIPSLRLSFILLQKTLGQRFNIFSFPSPRFIISINHCCSSNRVPASVILSESALSSIIYLF